MPELSQDFEAAASELERLAAAHGQSSVREAASELRQKLAQNRFHLVVVGQFKRGKTSFLNALLGEAILPVAVLPLTSVVTLLRYGEQPGATVHFQSGRTLEIELARLEEFVTERGNPHNRKQVGHVVVRYPSPYLRGGVTLIDTPGVASVYQHNTQVTYEFLPRIDAAIFVTSPEPPLTSAEIEFLRDLGRQVGRIFLVMNKSDLLGPDQLGEVIEFTRRSLPENLPADDGPVFAVSARQALEAKRTGNAELLEQSGFPALERRIARFLSEEKQQVFQASVGRRLTRLAAELQMLLELQIRAARMPVEALRDRIAEFERQLSLAKRQREDNAVLLKAGLARLCAAFEAAARSFAEQQREPLAAAVRARFNEVSSLGRKRLAAEMDRFLAERIRELFEDWRQSFEAHARQEFRQVTARFQAGLDELAGQARRTAGELFGVAAAPWDSAEELVWLEPTGYYTDTLLDWGLGNAPLLLPGPWFRGWLLRRVLKAIPEELERNATRVAYDFKRRLQTSVAQFQQALEHRLDQTIQGIHEAAQAALQRQQTGAAQAEQLIAGLSRALEELQQLRQRLNEALQQPAAEPSMMQA